MKLKLSQVENIINHLPDQTSREAGHAALNLLKDRANDEAEPPKQHAKKQYVILDRETLGWAIQIEESESPATATDRIKRAMEEFNASKKGRLCPVTTFAEAFENVPARFFKNNGVWIKHKIAAYAFNI
jgi:hypothetical protein